MFPMAIGLAAIADSLVRVLLTDKWVPEYFSSDWNASFMGHCLLAVLWEMQLQPLVEVISVCGLK